MYDTRVLSKSPAVGQLSQASTPSSLAPSPVNAYHVASGGYDGVVRVWDLRSVRAAGVNAEVDGAPSVAVASFRVPEKKDKGGDRKVLALDWVKGLVGVGGEAGLDVWRVPE
jgi:ribosome biogenesis protein YTM1